MFKIEIDQKYKIIELFEIDEIMELYHWFEYNYYYKSTDSNPPNFTEWL